jgi:thiol-disulfide isomerase/thioredoxin
LEFREWASDYLYVETLKELMIYTWNHPDLNGLDVNNYHLPEKYYEFLNNPRHNDIKLLRSLTYFRFLNDLYLYLTTSEFRRSDKFDQYQAYYRSGNKIDANKLKFQFISENTNGFEKEFILSSFFSDLIYRKFIEVYDAIYKPELIGRDDFNHVLTNEYINLQLLITEPVYAKDVSIHHPNVDDEDFIFQTLPERFPDKVIYIDFWAPWCGPCMAEMPSSKKLQLQLKGKDIVFVFLASRCTEASWKATISERKLTGDHYILTDQEYSVLADEFNIGGIPRYMIIDKTGLILNDDAPRPSDEKLYGLLETLSLK